MVRPKDVAADEVTSQQSSSLQKQPSPATPATPAAAEVNMEYVNQQIGVLESSVPATYRPVIRDTPRLSAPIKLRGPQTRLITLQLPTDGTLWSGSLLLWLRSPSVLQIIKQWVEDCWQDAGLKKQLNEFLPDKEWPWQQQNKLLVGLARKSDAGRATVKSGRSVQVECAIAARRLFLCNYATLTQNSPDTDDYVTYRLLDLPCAIILTAAHDLRKMKGQGFFGKLLNSSLALPMHKKLRCKLEEDYIVDPALNFNKKNADIFFTPSKKAFTLPPAFLRAGKEINTEVRGDLEPFTDKEKLGFLTALRDWHHTKRSDTDIPLIDLDYIAEILPGRTREEITGYWVSNGLQLRVPAAAVASPGHSLKKRSRDAVEGSEGGFEGDGDAVKKARKVIDTASTVPEGATALLPPFKTAHPEMYELKAFKNTAGTEAGMAYLKFLNPSEPPSLKSKVAPKPKAGQALDSTEKGGKSTVAAKKRSEKVVEPSAPRKFRADPVFIKLPFGKMFHDKVLDALVLEAAAEDACDAAEEALRHVGNKLMWKKAGFTAAKRHRAAESMVAQREAELDSVRSDVRRNVTAFRQQEKKYKQAVKEERVAARSPSPEKVVEVEDEEESEADDMIEIMRSRYKKPAAVEGR